MPDAADLEHLRLAGVDTHLGGEQLKHYWLIGEGAAKWKTWTELYHHLLKYLSPGRAKETAAAWFHERYGFWPGDKKNRSVPNDTGYGTVAITADPWLNAYVQPILTHGLPPLPDAINTADEAVSS